MVTQEELLKMIQAHPRKYTLRDFADIYQMQSTEDFIALNKMISAMEEEFLIVRDEKNRYTEPKESRLYQGKLTVNRRGFAFLDLDDEHSIFIPKTDLNLAMDQDLVIVQAKGPLDENPEGEVIRILKRSATQLIGTYCQYRRLVFVPDDERITQFVKVQNEKEFKLIEGLKVQCSIVRYGDPLIVRIERILGHKNDPGVDIQAVLLNHGIESEFPREVMKQLKGIPDHVVASQRLQREDWTGKTIVTIDGDDSKDFDDAISIEKTEKGYLLGVHIADVSAYVPENSPLDLEARKRGTSTYVVDRVVPMLPHYLSNGICSLNEGVERLTLSCVMEIQKDGEIADYRIFPSIIRSTARMTYNQVNRILEGDLEVMRRYEKLVSLFHTLFDCAQIIRNKRHEAGAIDFDKDEAKIQVDAKGKVVDIKIRERGEAERIIEDFMVTANECVARHTKWLQVPSLYRVHEAPTVKKMRDFVKMTQILGYQFKGSLQDIHPLQLQQCLSAFKEEESYPVVSTMMLRCMQKARYDSRCIGHFGLGLQEYTHFTSPIRRYPDLIVHRMLRKYCFVGMVDAQRMNEDEQLMELLGESTSVSERRSIEAEREVEDMKKAEYMRGKLGQKFDGVISSITKFGFYVALDNTVEGLVHIQDLDDDYYHHDPATFSLRGERTGRIFKLGQKVRIQVVSADKEKREIGFVLSSPKKRKKTNSRRKSRV